MLTSLKILAIAKQADRERLFVIAKFIWQVLLLTKKK